MSTTSVLAEVLAVGFQALLLLFGMARLCGAPGLDDIAASPFWDTPAVLLSVAGAYVAGAFLDRLCDLASVPLESAIWRRVDSSACVELRRYVVCHHSPGMCRMLEYIRSRIRLSRAGVVVAVGLLVLHITFILTTSGDPSGFWFSNCPDWPCLVAYLGLVAVSVRVFWESQIVYVRRASVAFDIVSAGVEERQAFEDLCRHYEGR